MIAWEAPILDGPHGLDVTNVTNVTERLPGSMRCVIMNYVPNPRREPGENMHIGSMIDVLYDLRQQRLELSKTVDNLKAQETAAREEILAALDGMGCAKASGHQATCGVKESIEPVPEDWEMIHNYIRIENRFDLIQKRLSAPAWRELRDSGLLVPGTSAVTVRDLSLTKSVR